jgi:hypothetical protein
LQRPGWKKICWLLSATGLLMFFAWRMIRPMNIFVVSDEFAWPMEAVIPSGLASLRAEECGECHSEIYREWRTSMHAMAWTDPYYQVDFIFDGSQQICLNCHIPLQNQQENLVLGFRDSERFKPILKPNPEFDAELQREGVTCAVCHVRGGVIIGPYGDTDAPHPTRYDQTMTSGMGTCRKCHVVSGKRWDTFYRVPPCGTVAEIEEGGLDKESDCVGCHMPSINRPLENDAVPRQGRMHLWRGGHSREMVRAALKVDFNITTDRGESKRATITLTNIGADHYLPTGTPDRHLSLEFRLKDQKGITVREKSYLLKRHILWRPLILDLWDTRLAKDSPQSFSFIIKPGDFPAPVELEVSVRYHLLDEARRKRIAYNNQEPISYPLYQHRELLK